MKGTVSAQRSVGVDELPKEQLTTIARVFKIPVDVITQFRWGNAMAPVGHPHHKTMYFTIEYGEDTLAARETLRVDSTGNVVERTKE